MAEFENSILRRVKTFNRYGTAKDVVEDIRQNIQTILNSRLSIPGSCILRLADDDNAVLLNSSILNFGIADFQSLNLGAEEVEERLCNSIRIAIERFETRLTQVNVQMKPTQSRVVNIEVRAVLDIEPFGQVAFDSGISFPSQKVVVT